MPDALFAAMVLWLPLTAFPLTVRRIDMYPAVAPYEKWNPPRQRNGFTLLSGMMPALMRLVHAPVAQVDAAVATAYGAEGVVPPPPPAAPLQPDQPEYPEFEDHPLQPEYPDVEDHPLHPDQPEYPEGPEYPEMPLYPLLPVHPDQPE